MPRLSDSQLVVLNAACQHEDRCVFPITSKLKGNAAGNVLKSLLIKGLLQEVPGRLDDTIWRQSNCDPRAGVLEGAWEDGLVSQDYRRGLTSTEPVSQLPEAALAERDLALTDPTQDIRCAGSENTADYQIGDFPGKELLSFHPVGEGGSVTHLRGA